MKIITATIIALAVCGASIKDARATAECPTTSPLAHIQTTCVPDNPTAGQLVSCAAEIANVTLAPNVPVTVVLDVFRDGAVVGHEVYPDVVLGALASDTFEVSFTAQDGNHGIGVGLYGQDGCTLRYVNQAWRTCVGQYCGQCPPEVNCCQLICDPIVGQRPCSNTFCKANGLSGSQCRSRFKFCKYNCWGGASPPLQ
ncbi:MAG: hypothetical protein EXS68_00780 [Candidatus Ryanbacteria bacterium]|nr:hypothetical protein [Candidatus Ryanbacteria bacterium]